MPIFEGTKLSGVHLICADDSFDHSDVDNQLILLILLIISFGNFSYVKSERIAVIKDVGFFGLSVLCL